MLSSNKPILSESDYHQLIVGLKLSGLHHTIEFLGDVLATKVDCNYHGICDIYNLLLKLLLERYKKLTIYELERFEPLIIHLLKSNAGSMEKIAAVNTECDFKTKDHELLDQSRLTLQLALKLIITHPEYEFFGCKYVYDSYKTLNKIIYYRYKYNHPFFYAALNLCRDNLDPLESAYWMNIFNLFYFNEDTNYSVLGPTFH